MVKTHEINLNTSTFNQFVSSTCGIILQKTNDMEVNDYILFRQVETVNEEIQPTGLFSLVQVKEIILNNGLKDGYALFNVNKLS